MTEGNLELSIVGIGDARRLRVSAPSAAALADFEGTAAESATGSVLDGPLSAANAVAVRTHVPSLRPQPIGLRTSAGVGDRLGLAAPGQVRAFQKFGAGIVPIFAQQSAREMDRLGRMPQQVLDDATFGCLQAGWDGPVGADADHLKSTAEIDRCLDAGFTLFTLDPGEFVRHIEGTVTAQQLEDVPWGDLEDDLESMTRRYADFTMEVGDGILRLSEVDVFQAAAKYGAAVAYTVSMYRHLMERATYPVEVEVSVDETDDVTTLAEHVYMATELKRLGVEWVSFAPRYVGSFEKGVDYIGDKQVLYTSLANHTHIARAFGPYKISLHSGSDKFSIYEGAAQATGRLVHLKTSGTNYLVAVDVASRFDQELFRNIYAVSRDAYRGTRASYQVSARLDRTPEPHEVPDERLHDLVTAFDSRQILHVGYGAVLRTEDGQGASPLAASLRELLAAHNDAYESELEAHIGRHLTTFSEKS
ncbi:hypothetical protein BKA04_001947 [Cryobacterium mesophilum]|uniref:Tagaturonate epimerase n=1 Tax=Terrimesophilobacter mesophilus TaxID=433647 RepID=A0A4R8VEY9_9MICO|nr:tagaturonate epimerase family protein [Terrimesophilobacter mesophilus]MBB5633724.1 hypothetical protein [Terrimesophilobacter mesophilus]TFB80407.1 hypothetical protein E3N84_10430 [Terrimesophilobacter mesophilus]